jgi:hypothetical protein
MHSLETGDLRFAPKFHAHDARLAGENDLPSAAGRWCGRRCGRASRWCSRVSESSGSCRTSAGFAEFLHCLALIKTTSVRIRGLRPVRRARQRGMEASGSFPGASRRSAGPGSVCFDRQRQQERHNSPGWRLTACTSGRRAGGCGGGCATAAKTARQYPPPQM